MPELSEGVEYVRLKDPETGTEFTYDAAKVEALGLAKHVIDKNPLGPDGRPAPAKPNLPLGEPFPGSPKERERDARRRAAEPPRSGRGSGAAAWVEYATGLGIQIPEGATRDDVVALVDAHNETPGAPVPGQEAGQTSADSEEEH